MSGDRPEDDTIVAARYSSFPEAEEKELHKILQQFEIQKQQMQRLGIRKQQTQRLEIRKYLEKSHQLRTREAILKWEKTQIRYVELRAEQDEDPPQSSFRNAISSLQQAFQYPFRLLVPGEGNYKDLRHLGPTK